MEHRYSERFSCNLTVTVSHEDTHAVGRLLNLSTLGFYISTDSSIFLPFQLLQVDINLRGNKPGKQYSFKGRVVRREADGIALELEAENGIIAEGIQEFIQHLKAGPVRRQRIPEAAAKSRAN